VQDARAVTESPSPTTTTTEPVSTKFEGRVNITTFDLEAFKKALANITKLPEDEITVDVSEKPDSDGLTNITWFYTSSDNDKANKATEDAIKNGDIEKLGVQDARAVTESPSPSPSPPSNMGLIIGIIVGVVVVVIIIVVIVVVKLKSSKSGSTGSLYSENADNSQGYKQQK